MIHDVGSWLGQSERSMLIAMMILGLWTIIMTALSLLSYEISATPGYKRFAHNIGEWLGDLAEKGRHRTSIKLGPLKIEFGRREEDPKGPK